MSTAFPTSLDSFPAAATLAAQTLATSPHSTLHGNLGDAVAALEAKVGVDSSAVTTSLDYRVGHVPAAAILAGTAGISITGNAATVTAGVTTTGSYADPAWITSLAGSKVTGNIAGSAAGLTATLAVGSGGTGQVTAAAALTALLPSQTGANGQVLQSNGAAASWQTPAAAAPGGSSGQLQYNAAGSFGGAAALAYATSGAVLTVTAQSATDVPLTCKGTGVQSGHLTEWLESDGTVRAALIANGDAVYDYGLALPGQGTLTWGSTASSAKARKGVTAPLVVLVAGNGVLGVGNGYLALRRDRGGALGWAPTSADVAVTSLDVGLESPAVGVLAISDGQGNGTAKGVLQLGPVTAPGTPATGFYLYVDGADGKLKCKGSSGTVTVLGLP